MKAETPVAIAVIERDELRLAQILEVLRRCTGADSFDRLDDALAGWDHGLRHLLVLGPSQATPSILERVGALVRSDTGCGALLVVSDPDPDLMRAVVRAGVHDAIPFSGISDALTPAVTELLDRLKASRPSVEPSPVPQTRRGRVVAVFSPKGGVGRSTIAVNLAVLLAKRSNERVVVVDADPEFGDVSVLFRLNPARTILDAIDAGERLDVDLLASLLTTHHDSGVAVLAAPADPTLTAKVTPQSVSMLLQVLRDLPAMTVVDMPRTIHDVDLQFLAESDDIVFVTGMDVPSMKNARLGLQALELARIPLDRIVHVLNRADSNVRLSPRDVEKTLQLKVDVSIPSDVLVPRSMNLGTPAVLVGKRSRFAARLDDIATMLLSRTTEGAR